MMWNVWSISEIEGLKRIVNFADARRSEFSKMKCSGKARDIFVESLHFQQAVRESL